MKTKCIFIAILIAIEINIHCQTWRYYSDEDAFDGNYKVASIVGTGYEFPYIKPLFVINSFENKPFNIYVTDVGCACCDNLMAYIKFDKNDELYSYSVLTNSEQDTWFIQWYTSKVVLELFNNIKAHAKMYVRLTSDCSQDDFIFSLSGSTVAVNYVTADYVNSLKRIEQENEQENAIFKQLQENKKKKEQILFSGGLFKTKVVNDMYYGHIYYRVKSPIYDDPKFYYINDNIQKLKNGDEIIISDYIDSLDYCILHKASSFELNDTDTIFYIHKRCIDFSTIEKIE
jgi:hypothetical protein